jgi:two-component system phosphate regulon sensor histidine kinase PhoR
VALPLGSPSPWIICIVWWAEDRLPGARALLEELEDCLTAATLPAHLLDLARRAEYEQAERRAIFAATSEAILSIGSDSIIKESNPAFARMMAWQDQSPVNRRCSEVLRCRDSHKTLLCDTPQCPLQQVLVGETPLAVQELTWETSAGDLRDVSASFSPHRLRDTTIAVVVARDDTTLNVANRMKASFISMVSHELRTPLNSINGFIEIVADEQVGPLNPRQQEFLGYVRTSALQLSALVEDVLLITKADSGQFSLRPTEIDAERLLRLAMHSVTGAATQAEVTMTLDVDAELPALRGDELRLQQVFTNLLNNAIKFSPSHEAITISVRRTGQQAEFSISDRGPGVAAEEHGRIFERFYQSEGGQRARSGGYGLGLAIAKLIVEQHGGRIWIDSSPGEGATFYVALRLADDAGDASATLS